MQPLVPLFFHNLPSLYPLHLGEMRISYNMARRHVAGLFRPTPEGGINRNIPTRHVIIDFLPIMTSNHGNRDVSAWP